MKQKYFLMINVVFVLIILVACSESPFKNASIAYNGPGKTIMLNIKEKLRTHGGKTRAKIKVILPQTRKNRQEVLSISYQPRPDRVYYKNGNAYAEYTIEDVSKVREINIYAKMRLYEYGLAKAMQTKDIVTESQSLLRQYQLPEKYIESNDSQILQAANRIYGTNDIDILRNIHQFVQNAVKYDKYNPDTVGAAGVLRSGVGDCTEYATLFAALARAKGIPARVVYGLTTEYNNTPKHEWVEAYTQAYGWVPFDPTFADSNDATFEKLNNIYINLSQVKNDPEINNYHYYAYHYWGNAFSMEENYTMKPAL
jgi:transglutaminase-like putative cysteine protease